MKTNNMNEQSSSKTKQTRGGVVSDDRSKEPDFSGGREAPASDVEATTVREKQGVASDDKSKGFDA